jgi:hypothetical protein
MRLIELIALTDLVLDPAILVVCGPVSLVYVNPGIKLPEDLGVLLSLQSWGSVEVDWVLTFGKLVP